MTSQVFATEPPSLRQQLEEKAKASAARVPREKKAIMEKSLQDLRNQNILKTAKKTGDQISDFSLPNAAGKMINLKDLRKNGDVIITFYRGGWCPYCNLALRAMQLALPDFKSLGAQLIAISPETPDHSLSTKEKNDLEFEVLSDAHGKVAKEFGLIFKLDEELKKLYLEFGIDLSKANGNESWELPISGTFIVNQEGRVIYSWVDVDYRKRAEPAELIQVLKANR